MYLYTYDELVDYIRSPAYRDRAYCMMYNNVRELAQAPITLEDLCDNITPYPINLVVITAEYVKSTRAYLLVVLPSSTIRGLVDIAFEVADDRYILMRGENLTACCDETGTVARDDTGVPYWCSRESLPELIRRQPKIPNLKLIVDNTK